MADIIAQAIPGVVITPSITETPASSVVTSGSVVSASASETTVEAVIQDSRVVPTATNGSVVSVVASGTPIVTSIGIGGYTVIAADIFIADAGDYYTGGDVEAALQEIGAGTTLDGRYLQILNNLSDLNSASTSRTNLGISAINTPLTDSAGYYTGTEVETALAEQGALNKLLQFFNGIFLESFDALITSAGGVITLSLQKTGTGDLTMVFSDGYTTLDCTPAQTIVLTVGTDTVPVDNFVYILQSDKILTRGTAWPEAEHIKIAYSLCQSAATTATEGALVNQNWNDHVKSTSGTGDGQGHLTHISQKVRQSTQATYQSGVAFTFTAGPAANIYLGTTAGVIEQMHPHTFASTQMPTDDIEIVNHATAYTSITDLASMTQDSTGSSLSNKYFNVVFFGVANKTGESDHVMALLPSGSYNLQSSAENDVDNYTVFTIPSVYTIKSSTGFYICLATFKWSGGLTNLATVSTTDFRGRNPDSMVGGGAGLNLTEFADTQFKVFDDGDSTKIIDFQASGITTGNTRTITMPDVDITLHTQGTDTALGALSTKNPPIDADKTIYRDSTSSDALVTSTWTQVKAFLKTYFDTIYSAREYLFPFATYIDLNPMTATNKFPLAGTLDRDVTFSEWSQSLFITGASHDVSNYYTLDLYLRQGAIAGDAVIATLDSKTVVSLVEITLTTTTFSPTGSTGNGNLYMKVSKTGTPSDLYIINPALKCTY